MRMSHRRAQGKWASTISSPSRKASSKPKASMSRSTGRQFRGTQSSWKGLNYLERPQDQPYTKDKARRLIQGACVWGSICNASAGMGKFVAEAYGDSPWAIFVRTRFENPRTEGPRQHPNLGRHARRQPL